MAPLPVERLTGAAESVERYHFRIVHTPGLAYEGEVDAAADRRHYHIGLGDGAVAEVLWEGGNGYGRRLDCIDWWPMARSLLHNPLVAAADAICAGHITSVEEEAEAWLVDFEPSRPAFLDDPEALARRIAGQRRNRSAQGFITQFTQECDDLVIQGRARVRRDDHLVTELVITARSRGLTFGIETRFGSSTASIPPIDSVMADCPAGRRRVVPEFLLLTVPYLGGWECPTEHAPWAQRSIKLIEACDQAGHYAEIYRKKVPEAFAQDDYPLPPLGSKGPAPNDKLHHPIVLGAWHEDNHDGLPSFYANWFQGQPAFLSYLAQGGYGRYYHHYGGGDDGLEYGDYMALASAPKPPTVNAAGKDCYYSARDWGYGLHRLHGVGGESLNLLTFTRAIEQYHRYGGDGKRNAYLLLGHVVHLLQDTSEPDHVLLAAHPASSMNDPESDSEFHRCHIAAGIAATAACGGPWDFICWGIVFGIAYGSCQGTLDPGEVGYERIVMDKWRLDRVEDPIVKNGVLSKPNYDAYFQAMSGTAQNALADVKTKYPNANLEVPLGCDEFTGIAGLDPFIHSDDPTEVQPFLELTDRVVPDAVKLSAGLIQHFYDVVNYPPYVKRVSIVQWQPTGAARPKAFGQMADDATHCVRYDTEWVDAPPTSRTVNPLTKKQYLTTDRPAFVFVQFGPAGIGPTKSKAMTEVRLHVTGKKPGTSTLIDIEVKMEQAEDDILGPYYWGYFTPRNCCKDPYMLTLQISGRDAGPHFDKRPHSGAEVDAEPATMARVDINSGDFHWMDYAPGVDSHHTIMVSAFNWQLTVDPQPLTIASFSTGGALEVELRQRYWDCQWEPTWDIPTCPVEWKLDDDITYLATMTPASPAYFGLTITKEVKHNGLKLRIEPETQLQKPRRVPLGVYQVHIEYTLGEPPESRTITPTFEIV